MRIVLDTNSLIQCVGHYSSYNNVWSSILSGQNTLCITNEILFEYTEILNRFFNQEFAETVINAILESRYVERFAPEYHFQLITADPDDNKFVDCAIQANARYIVTNDHHYDVLRTIDYPVVDIMALKTFSEMLKR